MNKLYSIITFKMGCGPFYCLGDTVYVSNKWYLRIKNNVDISLYIRECTLCNRMMAVDYERGMHVDYIWDEVTKKYKLKCIYDMMKL